MQQLMIVDFRGHPAIVKELGLFTLTECVDPTEVSGLVTKTDASEVAATKAMRELKDIKEGFTAFKRKVGQMREELKVLKNKTKNLWKIRRVGLDAEADLRLKRPWRDDTVRPTLRGLTCTMIALWGAFFFRGCAVFGESFPGWMGVLKDQGYRPRVVVLPNLSMLELIESLVDWECGIWVQEDWTYLAGKMPNFEGEDLVGFVDGRVTGEIGCLGEALRLTKMLGTKSLRRLIPGWLGVSRTFGHAFLGGVTTGQMSITCLVKGSMVDFYGDVQQAVPRDASTVMVSRHFVGEWREAPSSRTLEPLRCANLGTDSDPIYHSGGLLPGSLDRTVKVAVPSQFAPVGNWGARTL
jgi:hypothetical protein